MSFVNSRIDFGEMKSNYIGGIVGGIIGGWILMTAMGTVVMEAVANANFLNMLATTMKVDVTMSTMFHLMMSIVYGLVFAFLVGSKYNGNTKLIVYGLIYGLILIIPLMMAMMLMGTDVIALMSDIPLTMMIMVNHAVFGAGVGFGVYYLTK